MFTDVHRWNLNLNAFWVNLNHKTMRFYQANLNLNHKTMRFYQANLNLFLATDEHRCTRMKSRTYMLFLVTHQTLLLPLSVNICVNLWPMFLKSVSEGTLLSIRIKVPGYFKPFFSHRCTQMYTDVHRWNLNLNAFGGKPESQNHAFIYGFFFPKINQESQF